MKSTVTWILVADGGHARIFENRGPGKGLVPVPGLNIEDEHLRDQDIESDRPGRSISSVGSSRSAIEPRTDPADYRETVFTKRVAETLHKRFADGDFSRLVIAADPTTLGKLRGVLDGELGKTIIAKLPKDLTHVPLSGMPQHFGDILPV